MESEQERDDSLPFPTSAERSPPRPDTVEDPLRTAGAQLRRVRLAKELTQEQLAERMHVSRELIGKVERGVMMASTGFIKGLERTVGVDAALREALDAAESSYRDGTYRRAHAAAPTVEVRWLERYEWYYRIWTALAGMYNDLESALILKAERKRTRSAELTAFALFHYAYYQLQLERFVREQGGLWLLFDPDRERGATNAVWLVWRHGPFTERDDSWLRLTLSAARENELDAFLESVEGNERGLELLGKWRKWFRGCRCDLNDPAPSCDVHQVINNAMTYIRLIDEDWESVAPWYRSRPMARYAAQEVLEGRRVSLSHSKPES